MDRSLEIGTHITHSKKINGDQISTFDPHFFFFFSYMRMSRSVFRKKNEVALGKSQNKK